MTKEQEAIKELKDNGFTVVKKLKRGKDDKRFIFRCSQRFN